ncbi:hypothetical protein BB560_005385 [Smittium megazygosporum]|uniref:ribonuclease T2 n=1 Tax=Smittium megazygosporum TaxID=133381 RepID=A0A2T9Z6H0_9FUNG|nr:hypothetical protein BB560_005385 [Smittium megazygosporum]
MLPKFLVALSSVLGLCSASDYTYSFLKNKCATPSIKCRDAIACLTPNADSCCTSKYGLTVMSFGWYSKTGPADQFTIHGLWPDYCNGTYLPEAGCDSTRVYDNVGPMVKSANSSLYDYMVNYWPSSSGDHEGFWTHEWNKHGTCLSTIDPRCYAPGMYSPEKNLVDFFTLATDVYKKYDILGALKKHGIVPTANTTDPNVTPKYTKKAVREAIKAELNLDSVAYCTKGGSLQEIWLYFYMYNNDKFVYAPATLGEDKCDNFTFINKY